MRRHATTLAAALLLGGLALGALGPAPAAAAAPASSTIPASPELTTAALAPVVPASLAVPSAPLASPSAAPAAPPALYRVVRASPLRSGASWSGPKLSVVPTGTVLTARALSRGWVLTGHAGATGWFASAHAERLPRIRYESTRALPLTVRAGSGAVVLTLAKGQRAVSTGRVSGGLVQLYSAGRTGWAPAANLRRSVVAKYQTASSARLYASATSSTRVATIPADYTVATRTNGQANGRIHVQYGSRTGWLSAGNVAKVALSTAVGRLTWGQSAAKNMQPWCSGVPVTAGRGVGNKAEAQLAGRPATWHERIFLDTGWRRSGTLDPNHPAAVAVQFHECAHILQYRAFAYDVRALDARMDRVYGRANGTEHMADCMAVAMGARLSGTTASGGTWRAGYGGKCTAAHLAAAKKLVAGQRP